MFNCSVSPRFTFTVPLLSSSTLVGLYGSTTLIFTVSFLPFPLFTVIVAVPSAFAVTRPLPSTVAYLVAELEYFSVVSALSGLTVVFSCSVSPRFTVTVPLLSSVTLVTMGGGGSVGVISTPAEVPSASTINGSFTPL